MEEKRHIVYLSGPITGNPYYKQQFALAEKLLRKRGYLVINPASLVLEWADAMPDSECWAGYLTYDLAILNSISTHAIMVRLPNWGRSKGSCLEQDFALHHHIPVKNITDYFPDFQSLLNG